MSVVLPIEENPSFRELHTSAYPLSILETNKNYSKKWQIQNFIQISFEKKYWDVLTYERPYFWFWNCFKLRISLHYPLKNVIQKIKNYLDKGYYIFLCVNEEFIPDRIYYKNVYFNHEILIFGYDDATDSFYTIGYNDKKKYAVQLVSYNDMKIAFLTDKEHYYKFYALKVKLNYQFDLFHTKKVKRKIKQYLNTKNLKKGVHSYNYLCDFIKKTYDEGEEINLRSFRTMKERAKVYELLTQYYDLGSKYKTLLNENVKLSETLFILVLKFNRKSSEKSLQTIISYIKSYAETEKQVFTRWLEVLSQ